MNGTWANSSRLPPRPECVGRVEGRYWRRRKRRWNRAREGDHLELKGLRDGEEGEGAKKENDREEGLWQLRNIGVSLCMGRWEGLERVEGDFGRGR